MNNGKQFEKTIALIQETFKDSEYTEIFRNYSIPNSSGRNREIDVLIASKINGFEMNIAIECKDYKGKIPVEKLEAFHGKCERIKSINKKIFISSNGFQTDAINAANTFGIELMTAEFLTRDYLLQLLPVRQIQPIFTYKFNSLVLTFDADEETLKKVHKDCPNTIYSLDDGNTKSLKQILAEVVNDNRVEIFNAALLKWMTIKDYKSEDFPVNFTLTFTNSYFKTFEGLNIDLLELNCNTMINFQFVTPENISGRTLKDNKGNIKASAINIKMSDEVHSDIIMKDDEVHFYSTDGKETTKLQTLLTYDSKTGKFKKGD